MIGEAKYEVDHKTWAEPKPFGFSGCFRLRNETQFMRQAVFSHLPWLDEAVLVVQPSYDGTVDLAYRMAAEDSRVKVFEYPFECDWIDTPAFYAKDPHAPSHLVHMSNWAFTKCRYSWIVKVEGDVIALSSFGQIIDQVKASPDAHHYYGRVVLNVAGRDCDQISLDNPRNGGWDEAVVPNHPSYHFERVSKWEVLVHNGSATCMGWSGLHMKRCKRGKDRGWNGETYVPFTRDSVRQTLSAFNRNVPYPGPDDPLGEDCLYEEVPWLVTSTNISLSASLAG